MKKGYIISGTGLLLFGIGASGVGSDGIHLAIFCATALAGLGLAYIGWRCERARQIKKARLAQNRNRCWSTYLLADCRNNSLRANS